MGFAQLNYSTSVILDMKTKSKEAQSEKTQFLRMLKLLNVICQPNCKSPRIYLHGNRTYAEKKNLWIYGSDDLMYYSSQETFQENNSVTSFNIVKE